ncbi:MAG: polysaccharide deacetylase family protein [Gaiellaceae bacterium]
MFAAAIAAFAVSGHLRNSAPPRHRARAAGTLSEPRRRPNAVHHHGRPLLPAAQEAALRRFIRIGLPLYCGGRRSHDVALTFDDGPGPYTRLALRILRRANAHASFFLVGRLLARYPTLPRRERALGTIGDHTWSHPPLPLLPRPQMTQEIAGAKAAIERFGGGRVQLFRPPYGLHDAAVDRTVHRLGMLEVIWSIDSKDSYPGPSTTWQHIGKTVDRSIRPGSIVLLHENRGQTLLALERRILPALRRRGLHSVDVSELLAVDPPSLRQLREGLIGCRGLG